MANNVEELIINLRDNVSSRLSGIESSLQNIRNTSNGLNNSFGASISGLKKMVFAGLGIAAVAAVANKVKDAIISIGKSSWDYSVAVDGLRRQLEFSLGSQKAMGDMWDYVKRRSDETGTSFKTNIDNIARLAGATKGLVNQKELKTIYEGTASAATVLGMSQEKLNLIYNAFSQMIGKGTVQMEELKTQLGDSFPGAMQLAAEAMGFTQDRMKDFYKEIESGKVAGKEFVMAFNAKAIEKFGEAAEKAANRPSAKLQRIKNQIFDISTRLGDAITPAITKVFDKISGFFKFVNEKWQNMKLVFAPIIDYLKDIKKGFKEAFVDVFGDISMEDVFNKIGNFLRDIKPLLDGFAWIAKQVATVVFTIIKAIGGIPRAIKAGFDGFKQYFKSLWEMIKGYGEAIGKVFEGIFTFSWTKIKEGINVGRAASKIEPFKEALAKAQETFEKNQDFFNKTNAKGTFGLSSIYSGFKEKGIFSENGGMLGGSRSGKTELGVSELSSGAPKVLNINISKLVEEFNVNSTNITESAVKVKEEITRAILSAINDVNLIRG